MIRSRGARITSILTLIVAPACAPALHEVPAGPESIPRSAVSTDRSADADRSALRVAREAWGLRSDPQRVREAEAAFLDAAAREEDPEESLTGAVRAKAWLAEHEKDPAVRDDLALSAVQTGQLCRERLPVSARCAYWLAIGLGLQARERPSTAPDGIRRMIDLLGEASQNDPVLDNGGPHRVLALVLMRVPGWPIGPGDPGAALDSARRALEIDPGYPPNRMALAEALIKNGRAAEGRAAYDEALAAARARAADGHPDATEWVAEAEAALAH